ncbi:MAG: hypothetical protein M1815_004892 [Lichina confinis]|nr:MAG: hypothetical protein M1815_004892 [Lichina confinis]
MNSSDAVDLTQRSLLPPPPGVKSNFANPETRGDTYKPVIIGFATLGTVAVLLRLYARARIVRKIGPDDWTSVLAMIFNIGWTVVVYMDVHFFQGRHIWDLPMSYMIPRYFKFQISVYLLYAPTNVCVKCSIFLLYLRIFQFRTGITRLTWFVIFTIVGFYFAAFFVVLFACRPWNKKLNPLIPGKCINSIAIAVLSSIHNIIIDLAAFLLPIREVLKLRISRREKIQLTAVFAAGLFACVVSVLRLLAFIRMIKTTDITWHGYDTSLWTVVEINVAILCACAPAIRPLVRAYVSTSKSYLSRYASTALSDLPRQNPNASNQQLTDVRITTEVCIERDKP